MGIFNKLARTAVEYYVHENALLPVPHPLSVELQWQQACYVTIFEQPGRHVRSMYGQALPHQSTLAAEIIHNTVNALQRTIGRPVRRADLKQLRYSVALLGPLQRVGVVDHLDPSQYGLYVRSDRGKSAILLPNRAGVETADDQLATAIREADIIVRQESLTMYRFEVQYDDD